MMIKKELSLRLEKLRKQMEKEGVDAALISTNVNTIYTAGRLFMGYHYIDLNGTDLLFVRRPNDILGENVITLRKPEQVVEVLNERGIALPKVLLLEGEEMPQSEWSRLSQSFSSATVFNGSNLLRKVRAVKTPYELELLRASGKAHTTSYAEIPSLYKAGMTDLDLQIEIEYHMRKLGNLGLFRIYGPSMEIYFGSLLAGDNASAASPYDFALGGNGHFSLPVGANGTKLVQGQAIMVDMGGNFTGYMTDQTRTFSIGKLSDKAYRAHNVALEIQEAIATATCPGITGEELYQIALDIVDQNKLSSNFMGTKQQAKFVGHGVGMVINELPVLAARSRDPFEVGMVFALEPKFVLEGIGAVGIENTFIVTDQGAEKITLADEQIIDLTV